MVVKGCPHPPAFGGLASPKRDYEAAFGVERSRVFVFMRWTVSR